MSGRGDEARVVEPSRESLRRALYRRGADGTDLARFLGDGSGEEDAAGGAVPVTDDAAPDPGEEGVRRRIAATAGAVLAVSTLVGVCLLLVDGTVAPAAGASSSPTARAVTTPPVVLARDSGPAEFATGRATSPAPGEFRYAVVSGDTPLGIASRFHVCMSDVVAGEPLAMQGNYLEPGAVLRLRLDQQSVRSDGRVHCVD